jgi:hypothetical protein
LQLQRCVEGSNFLMKCKWKTFKATERFAYCHAPFFPSPVNLKRKGFISHRPLIMLWCSLPIRFTLPLPWVVTAHFRRNSYRIGFWLFLTQCCVFRINIRRKMWRWDHFSYNLETLKFALDWMIGNILKTLQHKEV